MGYPTKVQSIKRKNSEQFYISFPSAVAQAMEFVPSETVEWIIEDKSQLILKRKITPPSALKKKLQKASPEKLKNSGDNLREPSSKSGHGKKPKRSR